MPKPAKPRNTNRKSTKTKRTTVRDLPKLSEDAMKKVTGGVPIVQRGGGGP